MITVTYILLLLLSFYLLAIICDQYFVGSLDRVAKKMKLSHEVAGATLMAVGSSAPELFTSLFAALQGNSHSDVGAGTIVGSAIFNILVIIGASALFKRAKLTWQPVIRDLLFYSLAIVVLLFSFWDGHISVFEALLFVSLYIGYVFSVTQWSKWLKYTPSDPTEIVEEETKKHPISQFVTKIINKVMPDAEKHYGLVFLISVLLIGGISYVMVETAVALAINLNISTAIIGLTVLAAGTSVPDLLSSTIVAKQGRGDMAIANAVGSNIFDILFGLGMPWLLVTAFMNKTVVVATENLLSSVFLLFATVIAVFFVLAMKKWELGRRAGILLIIIYIGYIIFNAWNVVAI